jgi:CRP/FNR family transcriptional regulator, cyclic AMP receptor protein
VALEVQAPGRTLRIETLNAGDPVGWSWLSAPYRWQLDARALEPCELLGFDGVCLRGKCETDHNLGYELMRRFAENLVDRLQATRLQLLDVYGHG